MSLIHSHEEKGLKRLVEAAAPNRSWTFQDVRDVELGEDPLPSTSHDGPNIMQGHDASDHFPVLGMIKLISEQKVLDPEDM
jgi:hypothetical protein